MTADAASFFPSRRRAPLLAGGALLAVLLAAGCGAEPGEEPDGAASGQDKPSAEPTTKTDSRKPEASPTTSAPPPPLTADDGTRYAACKDGTCEVAVTESVDIPMAGGTFTAKTVKPADSVEFELTTEFGGGNGTMKGHCGTVMNFYPGGGGVVSRTCEDGSTPTPPAPEPGTLKLQLVGWDADGAAVIRFVSPD